MNFSPRAKEWPPVGDDDGQSERGAPWDTRSAMDWSKGQAGYEPRLPCTMCPDGGYKGDIPPPNETTPRSVTTSSSTRLTAIMLGASSLLAIGVAVLLGAAPGTASPADFEKACADLAQQLHIDNATVTSAEFLAAGTNISLPGLDISCGPPFTESPADVCRVAITLATSARSTTLMEAWLPLNWTGRYLATGNGGIGGCIDYDSMGYGTSVGFAATGSNNGHGGQSGATFLNNEDVVTDYAWRALHTSVVVGKQVTEAFYGKPHDKSYYLGCSTGGRQGWKMAQDFPENFDGVVAGAPAFSFNNLSSWSGHFYPIFTAAGADGFPSAALDAVDQAILDQCDLLDGAADGILEDASLCNFRPEALLCPSGSNNPNSSTCITSEQAETIRKLFADLHGVGGAFVYPRMQPGVGALATLHGFYAREPFLYADHWFKYAVYNDANLDTSNLSPEQMAHAHDKDPGSIETWSGDLSKFASRGSKILHYHGGEDYLITSLNSNRYYDHVARTMGKPSAELDEFYRFFRISGMGHCTGGPGATFIGQRAKSVASLDPSENVLMAMVQWVEQGVAPESIVGTAYVNGTKSLGVDYKRGHCKFPLRNVHQGGDIKDPSSWKCVV